MKPTLSPALRFSSTAAPRSTSANFISCKQSFYR
jgi:hypothetical protein